MMVVGVGCCVFSSQSEAASVRLNLGNGVNLVFSDNGVRKCYDGKKKRVVKKSCCRKREVARDFRMKKGKVKRRRRC